MFARLDKLHTIIKAKRHYGICFKKGLVYTFYFTFGISLLFLVGCGTTNIGGGGSASNVTLTEADKGKTIDVNQSAEVLFRLKENPTTGYRWAIDQNDDTLLPLRSSNFSSTSDAPVGAGGTRIFTFIAKQPGTVHLQLKLWRAWQGHSSIVERYDVTIQIHSS
jgi:inhibitor of cysteine peptidase